MTNLPLESPVRQHMGDFQGSCLNVIPQRAIIEQSTAVSIKCQRFADFLIDYHKNCHSE